MDLKAIVLWCGSCRGGAEAVVVVVVCSDMYSVNILKGALPFACATILTFNDSILADSIFGDSTFAGLIFQDSTIAGSTFTRYIGKSLIN